MKVIVMILFPRQQLVTTFQCQPHPFRLAHAEFAVEGSDKATATVYLPAGKMFKVKVTSFMIDPEVASPFCMMKEALSPALLESVTNDKCRIRLGFRAPGVAGDEGLYYVNGSTHEAGGYAYDANLGYDSDMDSCDSPRSDSFRAGFDNPMDYHSRLCVDATSIDSDLPADYNLPGDDDDRME